jgi:predicted acetyltransferase
MDTRFAAIDVNEHVIARPSTTHESAFLAMVGDLEAHDPENAALYAAAKLDFGRYVQSLVDEERGVNLKEGWVPCTHRWLVEGDGALVGISRLRHRINTPFLASEGGHIGYDVAPSSRGKGYGYLALHAALVEAQKLSTDRVLLFTDESNRASRRIIERHGGELEAITFSKHWNQRVCRYWIRIPRDDG